MEIINVIRKKLNFSEMKEEVTAGVCPDSVMKMEFSQHHRGMPAQHLYIDILRLDNVRLRSMLHYLGLTPRLKAVACILFNRSWSQLTIGRKGEVAACDKWTNPTLASFSLV